MIQNKVRDNPHIQSGTPPRVKAPGGEDLEQNAGMIHAPNPEHLLAFKTVPKPI